MQIQPSHLLAAREKWCTRRPRHPTGLPFPPQSHGEAVMVSPHRVLGRVPRASYMPIRLILMTAQMEMRKLRHGGVKSLAQGYGTRWELPGSAVPLIPVTHGLSHVISELTGMQTPS